VHHAEIIHLDGESYRLKEAKERADQRQRERAQRRVPARKKAIPVA
jgi:hypothetical protein